MVSKKRLKSQKYHQIQLKTIVKTLCQLIYTVYEKESFLEFASNQSETLGCLYIELTPDTDALDRGVYPIEDNWILDRQP